MFEAERFPGVEDLETDLIERIYNVAISPQSYDDFMEKWEEYVGSALAELMELRREAEALPELQMGKLTRHFDMGFKLLEELGRAPPDEAAERRFTGSGAASMLVDGEGRIVWFNGAASRYFDLRRLSHIEDLSMWDRSREEFQRLVDRLHSARIEPEPPTILRLTSEAAGQSVYMIAKPMENGDTETLLQIDQVKSDWHDQVAQMLTGSFGLSAAEVQVAELLMSGATTVEIAGLRESSVNTVRTQIKALLGKMGAKSQTELVRLLVSISGRTGPMVEPQIHVRRGQPFRFRQRDGRAVPFHRLGPENGRPLIFFHGMLDGCDLNAAAIDALYQNDLTIYAPERPTFGSASGDKGDVPTAPARFAADVEDLLDFLGLGPVGLIGHMAGSVYAFATAARLGSRIERVINIAGGVPILTHAQFSCMSPRQRLVAYTARFTPHLLPFVLRAGIRQLDFGGEAAFMRALYENAPADLKEIEKAETSAILAAGYQFSVAQGHRAFETDSYHVVRNWSADVANSDVPVLLFHGREDPVVSCASVEDFANRLRDRARTTVFEGSGQLILYKHPAEIFSEIAGIGT